jgi:hypothetical protein
MRPQLPADSLLYVLGLLGGVGGSITLAAYGYWIREKCWRRPSGCGDATRQRIAYIVTGVFVIAMMIVGTALLYGTGQDVGGEEGLVSLAQQMEQRLDGSVRSLFLVGFFSAALALSAVPCCS